MHIRIGRGGGLRAVSTIFVIRRVVIIGGTKVVMGHQCITTAEGIELIRLNLGKVRSGDRVFFVLNATLGKG